MFVWTSVYYVGCKMMICQLYHSLHIYQSVLHSRQDPSFSLSFLPPSVILLFTYYWCGLTDSYFSVLYILLLILNCFITQIVPDFCSGSFFKLDPIFLWHTSLFFVVFLCFLELHGFLSVCFCFWFWFYFLPILESDISQGSPGPFHRVMALEIRWHLVYWCVIASRKTKRKAIHVHIHTHTYMYATYTHIYTQAYTHVCICACVCVNIQVHI